MFDFLGRHKADRRASGDRRRGRMPVTIGFEQLEGREMLSSGLCLTIIPSRFPPLASMPRPLVGGRDPKADGEGVLVAPPTPKAPPTPDRGWARPWSLGGRPRLG